MMKRAFLLLILFAGLMTPAASSVGSVDSPAELWRGFDPAALPLEIETLRTWTEDGLELQKLRFTGEQHAGVNIRVFAIQGAPMGGKRLPGVLHIHGGGQTASLDWVKFWARRGYVAVSFDFCGTLPGRTEFTDWGAIPHANMMQAAGGFQVKPTPRESSWYHWAATSRRALTLLARHPQVNPDRLGIFGVSVGGTLCWMLAASDVRVKTAVPIYGCGYNHDDRNQRWGLPELSPELRIYKQVLSPEAHAPSVRCPILFLNATNDFHGPMDYSFDTLRAVRGPVRLSYTPRYNHHLEPEQGANLPHWMDWQLKGAAAFPKSPELKLSLDAAGTPIAQVVPDRNGDVDRVEVLYTLRDRMPQARFWRTATATSKGSIWRADLPVMDPWDPVSAFANVHYRSGICLSSVLVRDIPGQLGLARASLNWSSTIGHGRSGLENWFYTAAYTDPNVDWSILRIDRDAPGGATLGLDPDRFGEPIGFTLSSHILNDPQFAGHEGVALSFDYRGAFDAAGLSVNLIVKDWRPQTRVYTAKVIDNGTSGGWNHVSLPRERFATAEGQILPRWEEVERIELRGQTARSGPPAFRRFEWSGN